MLVCLEGTRVHVDGAGYGDIVMLYEQADGSPKYEIIFGDGHRGFADNSKILQVSLKVKGLLPNVRRYFDYDILKNHLGFVSSSTEIDPDIYNSWVEEVKEFKRKMEIVSDRLKGYSGRYPFGNTKDIIYHLPKPKHMLLNGDYTTVVWQDGTHTIVKKHPLDEDDLGKAIMFCILKKMCGSKANLDRYLDKFTDNMVVKALSEKTGMNEFLKWIDAVDKAGGFDKKEHDPDDDFFEEDEYEGQMTIGDFMDISDEDKEDDGDDKK